MSQSKAYLSSLLFYLGIKRVVNNDIFISAIRNFPTSVKILTREICDLMINNSASFDSFEPQVKYELLKGIIRLLSVGKSIRYCHKINSDHVIWLIKFALHLANSLQCNLASFVEECLSNSPMKQNVVKTFPSQWLKLKIYASTIWKLLQVSQNLTILFQKTMRCDCIMRCIL